MHQPVFADDFRGGFHDRWRDRWHERWDGDIRFFRGRDFDLWRRGHWFHGWHDGRFVWWWIAAGTWYPYAAPIYPYPDPYLPPEVIVQQPPIAAVPYPPVPAGSPQFWYYCRKPAGYYPYVPQCQVGWQPVPAAAPHP
ncbi:MAG TPA: hypothetical protein VFN66_06205 [Burkholderiales bacterium]|nr:hypothetical protein [Burkholderiales bacterium]